jgi:predicted transposase YbfD/YdcC
MQKRGAPQHVQIPMFSHPATDTHLIRILNEVPEPRGASPNFSYSLPTILFTCLVSTLCGADDWEEMAALGQNLKEWIGKFVDTSQGIPSAFTLERVMSLIEPTALEKMLRDVAILICNDLTNDIIAIDGKSLRGSSDTANDKRAVHLLHAWSCENRVCLAQMKVDDKSNEITSICSLLDQLLIEGNIVTTDALNTQRATVEKIIEKGGHYVLPVKENQKGLLESIQMLFQEGENNEFKGIDADHFESLEKGRGRVEERKCIVLDASELIETQEWKGLQTAAKITRRRTEKGKTTEEVVYYISDLGLDATRIAKAIREHWGVENRLHYALDVVLEEDNHAYYDRNGTRNLSVIRKIVLSALERVPTEKKRSKKTKRLLAAADQSFRMECLKFLF